MATYAFSNAMNKPRKTTHMNYYCKFHKCIISIAAAALFTLAQPLCAQSDNRVTVPLTDPARPVTLRAHLVSGSITVKGADVKEVIVEARARGDEGHTGGR